MIFDDFSPKKYYTEFDHFDSGDNLPEDSTDRNKYDSEQAHKPNPCTQFIRNKSSNDTDHGIALVNLKKRKIIDCESKKYKNKIAAAKYRKKRNTELKELIKQIKSEQKELPQRPKDNMYIKLLRKEAQRIPKDDRKERNRYSAMIYRERKRLFLQELACL